MSTVNYYARLIAEGIGGKTNIRTVEITNNNGIKSAAKAAIRKMSGNGHVVKCNGVKYTDDNRVLHIYEIYDRATKMGFVGIMELEAL